MFTFPQLGRNLTDGPKKIPPPPTKVTFPPCPDFSSHSASVPRLGRLEALFRVKHIKLLKEQHLRAINLQVQNGCSIEELIPKGHLPPASWQTKPGANEEDGKQAGPRSNETLSNGAAVPGHEAFYNRIVELSYTTEEAYDCLNRRTQPPGHQPVRLTQFRRFWTELQMAGCFWDASQDNLNYNDPDVQKALEAQKEESKGEAKNLRSNGPQSRSTEAASNSLRRSSPSPITRPKVFSEPGQQRSPTEAGSPRSKPSPTTYLTYTGRRHSSGADMPTKSRDDLVRTFVEPTAWSFGCVVERTMSQPYLHVGTTRLTADHAMRVFRGPQDRQRSRAKILEGPLMALQCTHETAFGDADASDVDYIARELGALLVIAQERDREGKTEITPGAGQWWVDKPRWGGGSGDAVGVPLLEDDGTEPVKVEAAAGGSTSSPPKDDSNKKSRAMKQHLKKHLLTRSHKPPSPVWEKRVDYVHVGKAPNEEFDTIYMLSALNHHLALVRLHVHPRFLALLDRSRAEEALAEAATTTDEFSWYGVRLARSRWYDLFKIEDRIELMRALWGVMGWLMRDTGSVLKGEPGEEKEEQEAPVEGAMDTQEG